MEDVFKDILVLKGKSILSVSTHKSKGGIVKGVLIKADDGFSYKITAKCNELDIAIEESND